MGGNGQRARPDFEQRRQGALDYKNYLATLLETAKKLGTGESDTEYPVWADNGAKRALIPIENKRSFFDVSANVLEAIDPIFYGDMKQAAFKALALV